MQTPELAALYRAADADGRAFAAQNDKTMQMWQKLKDSRKARDEFKVAYGAKYGLSENETT